MSTLLRKLLEATTLALLISCSQAADRWAPKASAGPVNQLVVAGNACGPAALLAAYRCGDEKHQAIVSKIPGTSDKSKILFIIKAYGLKPSTSLKGRTRWTGEGINAEDLSAISGELSAVEGLRAPRKEDLFLKKREKPDKLIKRLHARLRESLTRGLPPVISLRRYVFRSGQWQAIKGHFITVVRVPEKIERGARSISFTYFDPWGGKKREGRFSIPAVPTLSPDGKTSSCLEAVLPGANIGKKSVRSGERTVIIPTMINGSW